MVVAQFNVITEVRYVVAHRPLIVLPLERTWNELVGSKRPTC